ncbi:MAG TPA: IclR family transcriptional regulator [Desulfosporosinus sp.]|nr:IclR family transcriptional regulator [Desulfosporosinus sp.]
MAVKSATRVMDVLDILRNHWVGMTLQELCNELDIPKSSMHELLYTMTERNYLNRSENKKYTMGFKLIELGLSSLDRVDVYQNAKQHMVKLVDLLEETVFMAVCVDDEIAYINKSNCSRSVRTNVILGDHKPMHCTALGKIFLAFMSPLEIERIVSRRGLPTLTSRTITDYQTLLKELNDVRQRGVAYENQEIEEGLTCIACPIFDYHGRVVAGISVGGQTERIEPRKQEIGAYLQEHTLQISTEFGYCPK